MEVRIEKVSGASRYLQRVTRAPAVVSIVGAEEIRGFGYRALADALRSVRGLYVSNDRNYSYLGSRGFLRPGDYNTRVLLLVDGHRMNDNIFDTAYIGYESILNLDTVERIEFIRGPSSSIYGSNAFFGVINVVTKSAEQLEGATIAAEAGTGNTFGGSFHAAHHWQNGLQLTLAGALHRSDGEDRLYYPEFDERRSAEPRAINHGVAEDSDREEAGSFSARLTFHDFTFSGYVSARTKLVPTASFDTVFNARTERTDDRRAYLDLHFAHATEAETLIEARAYFDRYTYTGDYPYDWAEPGDPPLLVLNRDESRGDWVGAEWQVTQPFNERHKIVVGAEWRENLRQDQLNFDETEPDLHLIDEREHSRVVAAFVQGEFAVADRWLLNAGVRHDEYVGSFGGTTNPRLGLIFNATSTTTVKALYGRAFRAPNAYERFYYNQGLPVTLDPEKISTYELALDQYFGDAYRVTVSAYEYRVNDLIAQTPGAADFYFANLDGTKALGAEIELEARYESGVRARVSYAEQRAEDNRTGQELTSSPRHLAKLNLLYPLPADRAVVGFEVQYLSSMRALSGAGTGDLVLANVNVLTDQLIPGVECSVTVTNLFDARHGYPGAIDHLQDVIAQPGRAAWLKLSHRF